MELFKVNVSEGGIPKQSVGTADVTEQGLEGDSHDRDAHSDIADQAVLILPLSVYETLNREGYDVAPGDLGENFTIDGLKLKDMAVGDRYQVGPEVAIEITLVRKPGSRLRELDDTFPEALKRRGGFFARVVKTGSVAEGDQVDKL